MECIFNLFNILKSVSFPLHTHLIHISLSIDSFGISSLNTPENRKYNKSMIYFAGNASVALFKG